MGSDNRGKALRRLDERLADLERAVARHEARAVELREVRERVASERALLLSESAPAEPRGEERAAEEEKPIPVETPAPLHESRRSRLAGAPREAAPVRSIAGEGGPPPEDGFAAAALDLTKVWEPYWSRQPKAPRVIYGQPFGGDPPLTPAPDAPATGGEEGLPAPGERATPPEADPWSENG